MIHTLRKLRKIKRNSQKFIIAGVIGYQLAFPFPALAASPQTVILPNMTVGENQNNQTQTTVDQGQSDKVQLIAPMHQAAPTPVAPTYETVKTYKLAVTAYSSTVDQTDNSPCITANGYNLCENDTENVIAANFLPFGTKVRIPEQFGDRVFTVQDRMNSRYHYHADVWMKDRKDAVKFGLKYATIEVVKEVN